MNFSLVPYAVNDQFGVSSSFDRVIPVADPEKPIGCGGQSFVAPWTQSVPRILQR